jgi:hypothetical protein
VPVERGELLGLEQIVAGAKLRGVVGPAIVEVSAERKCVWSQLRMVRSRSRLLMAGRPRDEVSFFNFALRYSLAHLP